LIEWAARISGSITARSVGDFSKVNNPSPSAAQWDSASSLNNSSRETPSNPEALMKCLP
jgi:hypothetical protein